MDIREADDQRQANIENDAANIFSRTQYESPERPAARSFKPWHKPRKQFVRDELWAMEIGEILELKSPEDTILRYFGLPGEDFLDIRHFHNRFRSELSSIQFLGLDRTADIDSNISYQEVLNLDRIDKARSKVITDDLTQLANENSLAWEQTCQFGPFDIINIDLCDSFGKGSPSLTASLYNAVAAIFSLQQRSPNPWSIFLTTRITPGDISAEVVPGLDDLILDNLDRCETFARQFRHRISDGFSSLSHLTGVEYFDSVSVAYAKWFASMAVKIRCKFSMKSAAKYCVNEAADFDMLSAVFRFEPIYSAVADSSGLVMPSGLPHQECQMIKDVPSIVSNAVDVDGLLRTDPLVSDHHRNASKALLMEARYLVDGYDGFCDGAILS